MADTQHDNKNGALPQDQGAPQQTSAAAHAPAHAAQPAPAAPAPMPDTQADESDRTMTIDPEHTDDADRTSDVEALPGNPGLSIASVIFGIAGVILALWVSWILSVIVGIVAMALGIMARRQHAPYPKAALAGQVLGLICILANTLLVVVYVYQLMSLGLL